MVQLYCGNAAVISLPCNGDILAMLGRYPRYARAISSQCDDCGLFKSVFRLSFRGATELRRRNQGEAAFRYAGFSRSLCSLRMTHGRFKSSAQLRAKHALTKQIILRNCGLIICPSCFDSKDSLCGRSAINRVRFSAIRKSACCRCLSDDFCAVRFHHEVISSPKAISFY